MNALRREIAIAFAVAVGGDSHSLAERSPYITRIYDKLVGRFQSEGWPSSDAAVVEEVKREVARHV